MSTYKSEIEHHIYEYLREKCKVHGNDLHHGYLGEGNDVRSCENVKMCHVMDDEEFRFESNFKKILELVISRYKEWDMRWYAIFHITIEQGMTNEGAESLEMNKKWIELLRFYSNLLVYQLLGLIRFTQFNKTAALMIKLQKSRTLQRLIFLFLVPIYSQLNWKKINRSSKLKLTMTQKKMM